MTYEEIEKTMKEVADGWNTAVVENALFEHRVMSMDEFLNHCECCGGNWGGMLLSGMRELYPKTYTSIPNDMGPMAWGLICDTLALCGVVSEE